MNIEEHVLSREECERLQKPAGSCPLCDREMTVGEEESAGFCSNCYFGDPL